MGALNGRGGGGGRRRRPSGRRPSGRAAGEAGHLVDDRCQPHDVGRPCTRIVRDARSGRHRAATGRCVEQDRRVGLHRRARRALADRGGGPAVRERSGPASRSSGPRGERRAQPASVREHPGDVDQRRQPGVQQRGRRPARRGPARAPPARTRSALTTVSSGSGPTTDITGTRPRPVRPVRRVEPGREPVPGPLHRVQHRTPRRRTVRADDSRVDLVRVVRRRHGPGCGLGEQPVQRRDTRPVTDVHGDVVPRPARQPGRPRSRSAPASSVEEPVPGSRAPGSRCSVQRQAGQTGRTGA